MPKTRLQRLDSKYVLENLWYKVRQDKIIQPDGKQATFNVVECGESAFVVPITADDKILLVRLFRYPTQHEGWEVPAGGVEAGEEPLTAAKRELIEETGMENGVWRKVGTFESMNGITDAVAHVFEVRDLTTANHNEQAEEGITAMHAYSFSEVLAMIRDGEIVDALSIAALMQFFVMRKLLTAKE